MLSQCIASAAASKVHRNRQLFRRCTHAEALSNVRVLDMSRVLAGPWATQLLADLGADVIKIERPEVGDDTRAWGPPFLKNPDGTLSSESAYYLCANRGKRSVAVDFTTSAGQKLIHKLVEKSDVFVENFKTGGLAKYNLDYQTLSRVNPRLIYCSITGFGQTGPRKNEPGYDFIIQGMGGLMSITGERNGPPVKVGVAVTDIMTGLYASNAILAALYHRNNSGQGQHIDMALFDTQVAYLGSISARILRHVCWYRFSFSPIGWQYDTANQGLNYLTSGVAPTRMGNEHPNIVPYSVLTTSDGHLIVSVGNESQYSKFCTAIGREDLKQDPRFVTNNLRVQNRDAMYAELNKVFAAKPKSHWIQILNQIQVSVSPINNIDEVFQEAQTHARDMKITMTRPSGLRMELIGNPIKMSRTPIQYKRPPPALGEHTSQVLTELAEAAATDVAKLTADCGQSK